MSITATYASSLGRIKATVNSFLGREAIQSILHARDVAEVAKMLEPTWYGPSIAQAMATYRGVEALEVGINRKFVEVCRFAYAVAPFAGRPVVASYLKRWDLQNLALILSAKAYGRLVSETDSFLVSDRQTPASLAAGVLSLDELRGLLSLPSLEAVVQQLVRYGYGAVLLPLLDEFQKTHNMFPLLQALERYYYGQVREAARFFQGDEWVVRTFLAAEIDAKNILATLKGRVADLRPEDLLGLLVEGGTLPPRVLADAMNLPSVEDVVNSLGSTYPVARGLDEYRSEKSLVGFDVALRRYLVESSMGRMRQYPLSLGGIFAFLLRAEAERSDLRQILYGKVYGWPEDRIGRDLCLWGAP